MLSAFSSFGRIFRPSPSAWLPFLMICGCVCIKRPQSSTTHIHTASGSGNSRPLSSKPHAAQRGQPMVHSMWLVTQSRRPALGRWVARGDCMLTAISSLQIPLGSVRAHTEGYNTYLTQRWSSSWCGIRKTHIHMSVLSSTGAFFPLSLFKHIADMCFYIAPTCVASVISGRYLTAPLFQPNWLQTGILSQQGRLWLSSEK